MALVREGLNGELIARLCHCSASSVPRTIIERVEPHYRERPSCLNTSALMNFHHVTYLL